MKEQRDESFLLLPRFFPSPFSSWSPASSSATINKTQQDDQINTDHTNNNVFSSLCACVCLSLPLPLAFSVADDDRARAVKPSCLYIYIYSIAMCFLTILFFPFELSDLNVFISIMFNARHFLFRSSGQCWSGNNSTFCFVVFEIFIMFLLDFLFQVHWFINICKNSSWVGDYRHKEISTIVSNVSVIQW